jgi:hypothetical protein
LPGVRIYGQATGDLRVATGARLNLYGQVAGSLTVEPGGEAFVYGMVGGNVDIQGGDVDVSGLIVGRFIQASGTTNIRPEALILNQT